jgi:hypothetical protein
MRIDDTPHRSSRIESRITILRAIAYAIVGALVAVRSSMRTQAVLAIALALTSTVGCAHHSMMLRTAAPQMPTVALHGVPTVYFTGPGSDGSVQNVAFLRHARALLEGAGARVVDEIDAGPSTPRAGDVVVRVSQNPAAQETDHDVTFTRTPFSVRIFDAQGVAIRRFQRTDEADSQLDTSDRSPIVRDDYGVITQTARAATEEQEPEPFELDEQTGERMAELFVAQLLPDLERAEALVHHDQSASEAVDLQTPGSSS